MRTNTFYFLTCSIIWGLTWIAIKYQLPYVNIHSAIFYRFVFSSLLVFALCQFLKIKLFSFSKDLHQRFVLQGLFLFCLNYLLSYWATSLATSALIALAFTSLTFFNMFGGRIFLNIPFEKKVVWGASLSFLGMGLISWNEFQNSELNSTSFWGFLIGLISTLSASVGNLISTTPKKQKVSILANNAWSMLYGAFFTLIFCLIFQKSFHVEITTPFVLSFLYLSIFGTVISFWAYLKLIENVGPSKASFTTIASPLIALAVSTFVENMQWTLFLIMGALLCLMGNVVALVQIPGRKVPIVPVKPPLNS